MKLRIKETENGNTFEIQYRYTFWFWINAMTYGEEVSRKIGGKNTYYRLYANYKIAKQAFDLILTDTMEWKKRKKTKKTIHDEINLNKESDVFVEVL